MKKEVKWANPENFFAMFRCTTVQYAESFLNKGQIKFNTPDSWVKYAIENSEGRGDKFEGTMAMFDMLYDLEHIKELNEKYMKYSKLKRMKIDRSIYLKSERDMLLPCFCFYILKNKMFKCPDVGGTHRLSTMVPASYFRDFMDNLEPCKVKKLDEKDKPAVIVVYNYKEFENRIIKALMQLGLKREEIIIARVSYLDFNYNTWWDFGQIPPLELAIKDIRFSSQSEGRIIINTDDIKIKNILEEPIEIGSLEDIASISKTYLYEGMKIDLTVDL
ncbi:hypothetical protein [Vallitalea guaymasensis]|uniref:Uncharacterized protein n=1 Tax=Vallitalea guaymasensis TaxID=1185412 RepID=A0A8J8SBA9_9FIRM|nr:hypothetical protein [Vallitalea guaymasensis]QUH28210.1 hypothetical protein HYG85_04485 [Vallitalea guaymasensis]